ncbi:ABC transporter permease [Actinobacillus succinogenes]|uniref:ABC-2 type transporter n=1 Tax=Actinobacillus succinogenes (strain ATCC 55618 / DSM 22257 / CCUG 43843 / 130Z) TaxID=339671 RepID=A6VNF9_ACTSZ|nr:ABC transporter permease [Actinobacillus succinogenes]ABR74506.1 ABC-2 type transporter [Actinobacillus succinogenes 130Z]PHI41076.1 ABC transporter permease [Actinobacillus succinogenes]
MSRWLKNVFFLCGKEFKSLFSDLTLLVLIIYMFSIALISVANLPTTEVKNASVGIVDHDHSPLSYRLKDALLNPYFKKVEYAAQEQIDDLMDNSDFTFIVDIPPNYQRDILAGRNPKIQILIDATAMTQANIGASYITQIFTAELNRFLKVTNAAMPIESAVNVLYNPNYSSKWFMGAIQPVGNLNLLTMLLVGAAIIRERERGTIEHLLVMPVRSSEIAVAKVLANGLVLFVVAMLSLKFVVQGYLAIPITDSAIGLFSLGVVIFIFSIASLGILLAVFAPSMPQFGLLCLPVYLVMYMLSGTMSPLENMPQLAQYLTQFSPTAILGSYAKDVLFRGASLSMVWDDLVKMAALGALFLGIALMQFKTMLSKQG